MPFHKGGILFIPLYMLGCLNNIIGIDKTCTPEVPVSGLYIQDLPGVDLKVADAMINSDYASGVRFLKDKIAFATSLMLNQIRAAVQAKLKYTSVIASHNIGYVDMNTIIPSEPDKLKGIQIQVGDYPYFSLFLQSISVFSTDAKAIQLYVYDLITGELLDTFNTITIANKEVNVLTNKTYYSQRKAINLFVCTDSDLEHYQCKLNRGHCPGCTCRINTGYSGVGYLEIEQGIPVLDRNIQSGASTGGLSVSYTLSCSIEPLLCNMSSSLGFPVLYKTGAVIMEEGIYTNRMNGIVMTKKEDWKLLKEEFEQQYEISIRALIDNMVLPNDICFKCNQSIRTTIQIP